MIVYSYNYTIIIPLLQERVSMIICFLNNVQLTAVNY